MLAVRHPSCLILVCLAGLFALTGCGSIDPDTLPPVPVITFDGALPGVESQLAEAYERVRQEPADEEANGYLAMVLQTYKQFNAAEIMYRRTRALEPREFDWAYLHGVTLSALGRSTEAIAAFRAALQIRSEYDLAKIRLAELLSESGDNEAAAQLYEAVLSHPPSPSEAYFSHGQFLLKQNELDGAIQRFEQTLRMSGDFGALHYQLGMAYRQRGESALAARHLQLAQVYKGESADSSDEILNRLLLLNRSDQPFVNRAKRLAEGGRLQEARRFIEMALERNPNSLAAHTSLIGLAASEGDFAQVDEHFEKAVAIDPNNAKIYFNLGMARIAQHRYSEASIAFEHAIELDDSDPNCYVQLAILNQRENQLQPAENDLRKALALDPAHQFGNWLLGELLTRQGKADEAIPHLKRAVETPHSLLPLMFVALAQAQAKAGDWTAAFSALDQGQKEAELSNATSLQRRVSQVRAELESLRMRGANAQGK